MRSSIALLSLLSAVAAFSPSSGATRSWKPCAARPAALRVQTEALACKEKNFLEDAWAKYVLLRPEMGIEELKNSTSLRTAKEWSWNERTPGTARTIIISTLLVGLFAIPALLANPYVLPKLIEAAVLSREGFTPEEVIKETGQLLPLKDVTIYKP